VATACPKCALSHLDYLKSLSKGPEWESSDEDSVGKEPVQIKSKDEKYKKSRSTQRKAASKKKSAEAAANMSSVMYIGHLPPHFEEHELVQFLKQFGKVLNLRVSRSKKTGNSKGFAFVQMQSPGIAAIVADTLAGYIMFGQRRLVCHVVPPDKIHKKLFFKQQRVVKEKQATEKALGMMKVITSRLVSREQKKRETLKELGIDYDFPGYAAGKAAKGEASATKESGKSKRKDPTPSTESTENKKSKKSKQNDPVVSVESTKGKKRKESDVQADEKKEKSTLAAVKKTGKATSKDSKSKRKDSPASAESTPVDSSSPKKRRNVSDEPSAPEEAKVSFKKTPERKSKRVVADKTAKPAAPQSEKKPKKQTKSKARTSL
jgi:nucleolar protein 15